MSRLASGALALVLAAAWPGAASAQYGGPGFGVGGNRPYSTSPYLNLFRPGNVGVNYYQLVRPEFQTRQGFRDVQQQFNSIPPVGADPAQAGGLSTGHPAQFNNLGSYFPYDRRSGGGGGRGRSFAPATAPPPGIGVGLATGFGNNNARGPARGAEPRPAPRR